MSRLRTPGEEEEKGNENPLISDDPDKSILSNPTFTDHDPSDEALQKHNESRAADGSELDENERNPKKNKQGAVGALEEGLVKGGISSLAGPVGSGTNVVSSLFSRRKKTFSAMIVSIAFVFIGFLGYGIISGPLKIINFGQNLISTHLGDHEDASDGRLSRMYRFFRNNKDVGETRIGYIESKFKDRMISQLREVGLDPVFTDDLRIYEGFDVDTTNRNSRYHGLQGADLRAELERRGFNVTDTVAGSDGKVRVYVSGTLNQKVSTRLMLQELGYGKLTAAIRARPIQKYGWVTWRPLAKVDRKINETFAETYRKYKQKRDQRRAGKVNGNKIDTTQAKEKASDPDADDTPLNGSDSGEPDPERTKDILGQIRGSGTLRITGGLAAASGVACAFRQVNDSWDLINFKQVFEVAMRVGFDEATISQGGMAGEIDLTTLGLASRELDERDENGKILSTYNSAKTYNEDTGGKGGKDFTKEEKELFSQQVPGFISWAGNNALDPVCSTAGQAVAGLIDVTLGVLSGGTATVVGGLVAGALVGDKIIDLVANLLAGDGLNVNDAAGAKLANIASYGLRAGGNGIAQQSGANILSKGEEDTLRSVRLEQDGIELQEKGLAYRLFNPYDPRTLAGKTVASMPSSSTLLPGMVNSLSGIFGDVLSSPLKIFSSAVSAQTPHDGYPYPFAKYGFSLSDLNNPLFENPFKNARKAAKILDSSRGDKYIDRALECYGVKIDKGPNGWDAQSEKTVPDTYDKKAYEEKNCDDQSTEWKRVRFFIFDTGVITAWACLQDDEEACTDLFGSSSPGGGGDPGVAVSAGDFVIKKLPAPLSTPGGKIDPKGVTLHWWGSDSGGRGIDALVDALRGNSSCGAGGCSVQFGITNEGEIYQMTPNENDFTYHAIGGNDTTFGIEMEGGSADFGRAGKRKYPEKFEAAVSLVKYLVDKYGLQINGSTACGNVVGIHPHKAYNHCGETKEDIDNYYFQEVIKAVKNG